MQVKVHFLDDWRYWQRGDEDDIRPDLAKMLKKEGIVQIMENKQEHPKKSDKKKMEKPPRDKMVRGGNKIVKK